MSRNVIILPVLLLCLASAAYAQLSYGDAKLNFSGTVSAGYNDDFSNTAPSDHSVLFGGIGDISGSYYNPNFLSFDVQPFYNQSRVNSTFQSITASSGVTASAHIFGGSPFPGSISYSSAFNSSGNFSIPGLANYTTHGNSDVLTLAWGEHLKELPSLDFSFSNSNNSYSVYGADTRGRLHNIVLSLTSSYQVAGFSLTGGFQHTSSHTLTPEFLTDLLTQRSDTGANSFSFGIGHTLPLHGGFSAAATHLNINTNFGDSAFSDRYNTSIDTLTSSVFVAPREHLNVGMSGFYTDNLEGTLYNTLLTSGIVLPATQSQYSSHDLSLTAYADYFLPERHLYLHAFVQRQQQAFLGMSFVSNSYNGNASYSNRVKGGSLNAVLGITATTLNTTHQGLVGLNGSLNYTHDYHRWTFAGGFGYSQATQTLLAAYTTSNFNYSGSVGRRISRRAYWNAYLSGARTLLTNQPGTLNSSHSYSTSLSFGRYSINGSYSQSNGNALLTNTGLVGTPIPLPVVNPAAVVFFNGKSYSLGTAAQPVHGLILSAIYSKALSSTQSTTLNTNNNNENVNFLLTYNVRKISLTAGYIRLVQGFYLSGTEPARVGSVFVGASRSFNFF